MLRTGLLGAGRIGAVHAGAIAANPRSELVVVSDPIAENADRVAAAHGARVGETEEIIADPSIDAVLVATPTDTHAALVEAATAAGKAVLCEKPIDLNLERARACQRAAARSGMPVMIGFNRRFDPNFQALKRSVDAGEIGKPELLSVTSFDPAPPPVSYIQSSGGLFRDMTIHDFDMASFIMGQLPMTVSASGTCVVDAGIAAVGDVDTAVVMLTYPDGALAVIKNSRRAVYGYDQRLELLGSEGLLQAQNVLQSTVVRSTATGVTAARPTYFFLERYLSAYAAEWDAFVEAVVAQAPLPVTLEDGVAALAVAEAATRSAQTGLPVKLEDFA